MNSKPEMIRVFPTLSLCFTCLARCYGAEHLTASWGQTQQALQLRLENSFKFSHSSKENLVTETTNSISSATTTMKYNFSEVQTSVHILPTYV